jgi:hypothetical protein
MFVVYTIYIRVCVCVCVGKVAFYLEAQPLVSLEGLTDII